MVIGSFGVYMLDFGRTILDSHIIVISAYVWSPDSALNYPLSTHWSVYLTLPPSIHTPGHFPFPYLSSTIFPTTPASFLSPFFTFFSPPLFRFAPPFFFV